MRLHKEKELFEQVALKRDFKRCYYHGKIIRVIQNRQNDLNIDVQNNKNAVCGKNISFGMGLVSLGRHSPSKTKSATHSVALWRRILVYHTWGEHYDKHHS